MKEFKRCKKCLMPSTRPGIEFNEEGICYPCVAFELRKKVDWEQRFKELEKLCDQYRKMEGYDCLITVSGGKDSMRQVQIMTEQMAMNPLCLMIDNFSWSETGRKNYYNLSDRFGVELLCYTPNRKYMKYRVKEDFINHLHPARFWDELLYSIPHEYAKRFDIELVVWGENPALEKGGLNLDDPENALRQLESHRKLTDGDPNLRQFQLKSIFLDHYVPWSRYENIGFAMVNGLKTLDNLWDRQGYECFPFEQVDTVGYLVNEYAKYIKFGFGAMTELCSDAIRHKVMTRGEGLRRVRELDWKIDPLMVSDFCEGIGMKKEDFWYTITKHANKDLLSYSLDDQRWKLREEYLV